MEIFDLNSEQAVGEEGALFMDGTMADLYRGMRKGGLLDSSVLQTHLECRCNSINTKKHADGMVQKR